MRVRITAERQTCIAAVITHTQAVGTVASCYMQCATHVRRVTPDLKARRITRGRPPQVWPGAHGKAASANKGAYLTLRRVQVTVRSTKAGIAFLDPRIS